MSATHLQQTLFKCIIVGSCKIWVTAGCRFMLIRHNLKFSSVASEGVNCN